MDRNSIGEKTSGHTTAKITIQHNLIYNYLIGSFGKDYASGYLEANEKAISNIKKIIDEENIDCDFEKQENFVYTRNKSEINKIKKEVDAINILKRRRFCTICNQLRFAF